MENFDTTIKVKNTVRNRIYRMKGRKSYNDFLIILMDYYKPRSKSSQEDEPEVNI